MKLASGVGILVCGLAGCGKKSGGHAVGPASGSGSAQVTYQPAVRVLEQDEGLAAVVGVSTDGWTLVFDGHAAKLQGLKAGDVVVIKGEIARKVLAVEVQPDGDVAAFTQSPTLSEAFQQADVKLDAKIRFTHQTSSREPSIWDLLEGTAHADGPGGGSTAPRALTGK